MSHAERRQYASPGARSVSDLLQMLAGYSLSRSHTGLQHRLRKESSGCEKEGVSMHGTGTLGMAVHQCMRST